MVDSSLHMALDVLSSSASSFAYELRITYGILMTQFILFLQFLYWLGGR